VKAILLNQKLIAGIGNLYADEILFRACMHPATEAARLSEKDARRLFRATHYVLEKAIALKTDFNRLPRSWLLTRRGKRGRCPRCGRALKSATIGGRTSWFCAHCQQPEVTQASSLTRPAGILPAEGSAQAGKPASRNSQDGCVTQRRVL
jgi:formamidopyrimidine-DNA glycosylase